MFEEIANQDDVGHSAFTIGHGLSTGELESVLCLAHDAAKERRNAGFTIYLHTI